MKVLPLIVVVLLFSKASTSDLAVCPKGCFCGEVGKVNCTGVDSIPNLEHKSLIHSMTLSPHNISELKAGDFVNFTHLEQLDLSTGKISKISAGAFDEIKTTVTRINLKANKIVDLDGGVFANLDVIQNIDLDANHLTSIKANSFVNLTSLNILTFRDNNITNVDKNAFIGLPQLEELNFFYNNLLQAPFEAIRDLKSLRELTLTLNKIALIPEDPGVFLPALENIQLDSNPLKLTTFPNVSKTLKILDLMFTDISTASLKTWKYLGNLEELMLSGTKFPTITLGTFEGLTNVKTLLMRDMPSLSSIGPDAFNGLTSVENINLASNRKFIMIDETAFMSTNIRSCSISNSSLSYIPEKLFKWSTMKYVSLHNNPINCDCKMKWTTNSSIFGNNTSVKASFDELTCTFPRSLAGRKVTSLNPAYMTCVPLEDDHSKRLVTGIVVAMICVVFFISFALLMKNRKRISIACRRYYQYRRYKNDLVFTVEHDTSIAELDDTEDGKPLQDMRLVTKHTEE